MLLHIYCTFHIIQNNTYLEYLVLGNKYEQLLLFARIVANTYRV